MVWCQAPGSRNLFLLPCPRNQKAGSFSHSLLLLMPFQDSFYHFYINIISIFKVQVFAKINGSYYFYDIFGVMCSFRSNYRAFDIGNPYPETRAFPEGPV